MSDWYSLMQGSTPRIVCCLALMLVVGLAACGPLQAPPVPPASEATVSATVPTTAPVTAAATTAEPALATSESEPAQAPAAPGVTVATEPAPALPTDPAPAEVVPVAPDLPTPTGEVAPIMIDAPVGGERVTPPVEVRGRVTAVPFENNLVYRVYDSAGVELLTGPITVEGEQGQPGTFVVFVEVPTLIGDSMRIVIADVDQASGADRATATVDILIERFEPTPAGMLPAVPALAADSSPVAVGQAPAPANLALYGIASFGELALDAPASLAAAVPAAVRAAPLAQGGQPDWGPWLSTGSNSTSSPTVASWQSNRLDLFVRGNTNQLLHRSWDGARWSGWESLGGNLRSAPSCTAWGINRLSCFAVQTVDNSLWHIYWDGRNWSSWQSLGGVITSAPSAVSRGPNQLDVFARGSQNRMFQRSWDGREWGPWLDIGGELTSAPGCGTWGGNWVSCFARGNDNSLWQAYWDGRNWSGWVRLGGELTSAPSVAIWGRERISVFARGANGALWHTFYDGQFWNGWEDLGERLSSAPGCVSWGANRIDCFARAAADQAMSADRGLVQRSWGVGLN